MILNPKEISWTPPTKYEDGSAFTADDFAGYEWGFRPAGSGAYAAAVAIPVTFNVTKLDISVLNLPALTDLDVAMRTVAKNGLASEWSAPVQVRFDARRPLAPSAVSAR